MSKTADIIKRRIELKRQHIALLEEEIATLGEILRNEVKDDVLQDEPPDAIVGGRPFWNIGGFREA